MDYNKIFTDNILRIQAERGLAKQDIAALAGVSGAFVTDLMRGTANPTLKTMQSLSDGLDIPLPLLLKPSDSEEWQTLFALLGANSVGIKEKKIPEGFGIINDAILPLHKVYVIEQWIKESKKKITKISHRVTHLVSN